MQHINDKTNKSIKDIFFDLFHVVFKWLMSMCVREKETGKTAKHGQRVRVSG